MFTGEPAKNKKQAEKNAAMAAWAALKQLAKEVASTSTEPENSDELEHVTVAKALLSYRRHDRIAAAKTFRTPSLFPNHLLLKPTQLSPLSKPPPAASSKILPSICRRAEITESAVGQPSSQAMSPHGERRRGRQIPRSTAISVSSKQCLNTILSAGVFRLSSLIPAMNRAQSPESWRFPVMSAAPYGQMRMPYQTMVPSVTIRSAVPVFTAPPLPSPATPSFPPSVRVEYLPSLERENHPSYNIKAQPAEDESSNADENDLNRIISLLPEEFLPSPQFEYSVTNTDPSFCLLHNFCIGTS